MPVPVHGGISWDFSYEIAIPYTRYFLATCCRAAMVNDPATRQAALAGIGDVRTAYLDNGPSPSVNVPLWYAAAYPNNRVLVVLGGTYLPVQWYSHLTGYGQVSGSYYPGKVHQFWKSSAESIGAAIGAALPSFSGPPQFFLTGHSWGGATAQILGYYLANAYAGAGVQVVTFGAPRVGNPAFGNGYNTYIANIQADADPICALPPFVSGQAFFYGLAGAAVWAFSQNYADIPGAARVLPIGRPAGFANHMFGRDNAALSALLTNSSQTRYHSQYYYTRYMFDECGGSRTQDGGASAADNGFDLAAIYSANAGLSVSEGLVISPAFPVPAAAEP